MTNQQLVWAQISKRRFIRCPDHVHTQDNAYDITLLIPLHLNQVTCTLEIVLHLLCTLFLQQILLQFLLHHFVESFLLQDYWAQLEKGLKWKINSKEMNFRFLKFDRKWLIRLKSILKVWHQMTLLLYELNLNKLWMTHMPKMWLYVTSGKCPDYESYWFQKIHQIVYFSFFGLETDRFLGNSTRLFLKDILPFLKARHPW